MSFAEVGFSSFHSRLLFSADEGPAIVVIGMVAYFVGFVRAPLTGEIIVSEMTTNRGLLLPLFVIAIVADFAANWAARSGSTTDSRTASPNDSRSRRPYGSGGDRAGLTRRQTGLGGKPRS